MNTTKKEIITIEATVNAPVANVWEAWTEPRHITQWCAASDDWHAPYAENDVRNEGRFKTTMAARDGSMQFDFSGAYTTIEVERRIAYILDDGRTVDITFSPQGSATHVRQSFEAEGINPVEVQRQGWQAILDNFKQYTESSVA